jgi:HK97 gp10 family phage protein
MLEIEVQNLDEVIKRMRDFVPRLQRKALRDSARKSMKIVEKAARAKLQSQTGPEATGALAKSITTRNNAKQGKRVGGVVMQVGIKGGAKQYVQNARNVRLGRVGQSYEQGGNQYYFRFIEFGTSKMRARPFLQPALSENVQKVSDTMASELSTAIDKLSGSP